jgi:3-polyprenyl-4-hydroxybenzoate decarboxylase
MGLLASFTGDVAHDQNGVSATIAERHPETSVIVLPCSTSVPSEIA